MTTLYFNNILPEFSRKIYEIETNKEHIKKGEVIAITKINKRGEEFDYHSVQRIHFAKIKRIIRLDNNLWRVRLMRLVELPHSIKVKLAESTDRQRRNKKLISSQIKITKFV